MISLQSLLSKRLIIRKTEPSLYYQIKDDLKPIRKFMQDKFGYTVILTPLLIKLEKIPALSEIWMGIQEFNSIEEYQMLICIIMFLEDKEIEEQFVLSHITEYIFHQFEEGRIDWTNFLTRRQLIRVIQYCLKNNIIISNDGDENKFAKDYTTEVLYENTGISRYFIRNFSRDIMEYSNHEDFNQSDWVDVDEDRGLSRRHRVYRKLLLSSGIYESTQSEDFLYLKNYRNQIQNDFQFFLNSDLHIHKTSAYLILDETNRMGSVFPENNAFSDLVLLFSAKLREDILAKNLKINDDEIINFKNDFVHEIMNQIVDTHLNYLPKTIQNLEVDTIVTNTIQYMETKGFIKIENESVFVYPILGKVSGAYIKEYEK